MILCLFYIFHYTPSVLSSLKNDHSTEFTRRMFKILSQMDLSSEMSSPIEIKGDILGHLGKQSSIANYLRHAINLCELNGLNKNNFSKPIFQVSYKNTVICIDCGSRNQQEDQSNVLQITNETMEISKKKTVRLKVIYICEYDKYKKYEIPL